MGWAAWHRVPGAAAAVPLQGWGRAVPVPELSDGSGERSGVTQESKANAINAAVKTFLTLCVETWSPSLRWVRCVGSGSAVSPGAARFPGAGAAALPPALPVSRAVWRCPDGAVALPWPVNPIRLQCRSGAADVFVMGLEMIIVTTAVTGSHEGQGLLPRDSPCVPWSENLGG